MITEHDTGGSPAEPTPTIAPAALRARLHANRLTEVDRAALETLIDQVGAAVTVSESDDDCRRSGIDGVWSHAARTYRALLRETS